MQDSDAGLAKNNTNLRIYANDANRGKQIIFKELSYLITGLCFKVHNEMGHFCKEKQYADRFEELLRLNNIPYKREFDLKKLSSTTLLGNRVDFIINEQIILEFKAKRILTRDDYYQIRRYLRSANLRLGIIINFRKHFLRPKRVLNKLGNLPM